MIYGTEIIKSLVLAVVTNASPPRTHMYHNPCPLGDCVGGCVCSGDLPPRIWWPRRVVGLVVKTGFFTLKYRAMIFRIEYN